MAYGIEQIEGIGPSYGEKLKAVGITTTEKLLERCASKKGREELAKETGIAESLILTWTNHADLFRIKGIAGQFAELLEAGGVDTVKEFKLRNAENLYAKLVEVNEAGGKRIAGRVPAVKELQKMIDQAKELPPTMTY